MAEDTTEPEDRRDSVKLKIRGEKKSRALDTDFLPPVGTQIQVPEHLTERTDNITVEVTGYTWALFSKPPGDNSQQPDPGFLITIKAKRIAARQ